MKVTHSWTIGWVKFGKYGKSYEVIWNVKTRDVSVGYAGCTHAEKAYGAREGMRRAEGFYMINRIYLLIMEI